MKWSRALIPVTGIFLFAAPLCANAEMEISEYAGACDASGAVAIDANLFVVADNEDETLRIYRRGESEPLPTDQAFQKHLGLEGKKRADLEATAVVGDLIFVIASHSDNSEGKDRPNRHLLFATRAIPNGEGYRIDLEGKPYRDLRKLFEAHPEIKSAEGRFNIEGLAATPTGELLVGFRGPLLQDHAIIVPILNPRDVIAGKPAETGDAITLDLDHRGIRSLEFDKERDRYLIVAGPPGDAGSFDIYAWPGHGSEAVTKITSDGWLAASTPLSPEALFIDPSDTATIYILSDDGETIVGSEECKDLPADPAKRFRGFAITLDK